jgi:murein DD-endopeptidase MepM/ murein hydrolase activator NlpD
VIRPGEVLVTALGRSGLSSAEIGRVVPALRDWGFNLRALRPGDSIFISRRDSVLVRIRYRRNYESSWQLDCDSAACRVSMLIPNLTRDTALIRGTIESSLYEALLARGEQPALVADYTDIFGWEVDFFSDPQRGDSFWILVERKFAGPQLVGYGPILASGYAGQVGRFNGWRFTDAEGRTDCYNDSAQSLRKTFQKSPLRFSRVSSFFGRRFHPIRRVVRQHAGVDYVAPKGTPVECVADGRVVSAGWSGGYGQLVVVGHADGYQTRYGHLSGYGRGVRGGAPVQQGQVIGYVGSTGLSTGPHLHFEVRKFGSPVNPLRLNPPRLAPVKLAYLAAFAARRDSLVRLAGRLSGPPPR